MTLKNLTLLALGLGLIGGVGCGDEDDDAGDDSGETVDSEDGDTDDSEEPEIEVEGTVSGTVTVVLYDDSTGEIESVEYGDVGYSDFPFGKIFIAAYTESEDADGDTTRSYHGDTTIDSPSIGGDAYSMDVEVSGTDEVYVYAHLDWRQDRVLGSSEPNAHHPSLVTIPDGGEISEIDIVILAPVYCGERQNPNCGGDCDTVGISGEVLISVSYAGGDVATFLQGTDGSGPSYVSWMTPTADGGGASGAYNMTVCDDIGDRRLRGAWDSNGNELIDPRDRWGAYSTGNDEDGDPEDANPISVGSSDLSGYDIVIPLGNEDAFSVVPFTALSGTLEMEVGGLFDETLPANTNVHIAALRYRPNLDISVSSLNTAAYSTQSWTWAELQGSSSESFVLPVPADTIVYLWAYGDTDADDVLNESGEFVGVPNGASDGRIPTGSDGYNGLEVMLAQP